MSKFSNLLSSLLKKRGIDKVEDLSNEEQATLESYRVILSGETVTIDSLKAFCRAQLAIVEAKADGITPLTMVQQAAIHIYINLIKAIEAPEAERESLERYITQLISQP